VKFRSGGRGPPTGGKWGKCPSLSLRIFGDPLRLQAGEGISEIYLGVTELFAIYEKNLNGREIETGNGRGPITSSSGSGPRGLCRV